MSVSNEFSVFSCDSSSMKDNVRWSVCRLVGPLTSSSKLHKKIHVERSNLTLMSITALHNNMFVRLFSCESSSMQDNIRRSVSLSVGPLASSFEVAYHQIFKKIIFRYFRAILFFKN